MSASILSRLERLESAVNANTSKTRKHFTNGVLSGAQGDFIITFTDNNGKPLDGWHLMDDGIVFVVDIE
jgi:hypothetical protein